jgi:peptide/nickel transport system permease protein
MRKGYAPSSLPAPSAGSGRGIPTTDHDAGATVSRRRPRPSPLRALARNPTSVIGLTIISGLGLMALLAPLLATHDPQLVDLSTQLQPPGPAHWFGTDSVGQDIYSRVVYGSRLALGSGLLVLLLATTTGSLFGIVAGYLGGWMDDVIMRITDMFMAFPGLILAMAIVAALQQRTLWAVVIAISIRWWTPYARLMRAETLSLRNREFIEAARSIGARPSRILLRHVLPNALSPIIVQASLDLGYIILTAAALSFIGFGAQPGEPEWGRMVADGREYMRTNWWVITFPGLAIFVTVLGLNLLGDGLRDVLDPRLS